nr:TPA_asm: ATP synthase F0 subunit 8 [Tetraponera rufonigra]
MPQMSPLLWVPALLLFLILLYVVISFNHYSSFRLKSKHNYKLSSKESLIGKKWTFKF